MIARISLFGVAASLLLPAASLGAEDARTLESLLHEVRQLRLVLERTSLVPAHVQLTMQRLTLHDQRIARLSAQLDAVRSEVARQTEDGRRAGIEVTMLEQRLSSETDTQRRKQMTDQLAMMKRIAGQPADPALLQRESELSSMVRQERAAMDDLNEKLRRLEKFLESQPLPGK